MASPPPALRLDRTSERSLATAALLGDPHLHRILDILNPAGEETRLVGGAVRNALLGLPPGDIDLATTMPPAEVTRRAKAARLRVIPTGIAHGTVTLLSGGRSFEVTTLREDIETDGRHAVVRFGRDFARDAERRDFTMNALSAGRDGRLFDTVGGLDDLARGRVRFIGDAATRIREDVLRILRFFRFHATYGAGPLDPEGLSAATENRQGLVRLSRERVRSEMLKILAAPRAVEVTEVMRAAGILDLVLRGPAEVETLRRLVDLEPGRCDPILRLAALAMRDARDLARLRDILRLSNAETKRLEAALHTELAMAPSAATDEPSLRRMLFAHGREAAADALRLRRAQRPDGDDAPVHHALAFLETAPIPTLELTGGELMGRGLKGPAVGKALARLRASWAEAGFPDDPETIEALVSRAVAEAASPQQAG